MPFTSSKNVFTKFILALFVSDHIRPLYPFNTNYLLMVNFLVAVWLRISLIESLVGALNTIPLIIKSSFF